MSSLQPAAFLDRDGTINVDKGYLYRREDFEYLDGVIEGLRKLQEMGYLLVIVTNQSGIARGFYTEEDYQLLTNWIIADLRGKGIHIAGVYSCPHHPQGKISRYAISCDCRKPGTALFYRAARELNIDLDRSIAIGDKKRDLCICEKTHAMGILLGLRQHVKDGIVCCESWNAIIQKLKGLEKL